MPTSTFFRLPDEKRQRLVDAAVAEFTQTRYNDVSINKIIRAAHIPRGSFYQYFADKEDLFRYLMEDMREYFFRILLELLDQDGDLITVPLRAFDRFLDASGQADPVLARCIRIMQANPSMDVSWLFRQEGDLLPDFVYPLLDISRFRRTDRLFIDHTFFLLMVPLAHAIMATLQQPALREKQRQMVQDQLNIIRYGTHKPTQNKEDAPCATTN